LSDSFTTASPFRLQAADNRPSLVTARVKAHIIDAPAKTYLQRKIAITIPLYH
jgi:hypothetical protein